MRPIDLAREHGLSAQSVRTYERLGCIPPACRTPTGHRVYSPRHAAALRSYLASVAAYGTRAARAVARAVDRDDPDAAFAVIDTAHGQLARDRATLRTVRAAVRDLAGAPSDARGGTDWSVGELAHTLDVSAATVRSWEVAGVLMPRRDPSTGHRRYGDDDIRDARLAHLLRRGGHPLADIAVVVRQVRSAGGVDEVTAAVDGWQERITARGRAMLTAAARLDEYLAERAADAERRAPRGIVR